MVEEKKELVAVDSKMTKLQKGDMVIVPTTISEVKEFVKSVQGAMSLPKDLKSQDIFTLIVKGQEMGVPAIAALNNMFLIYGKISMYTDFAMGLIRNHPEYGGMKMKEIKKNGDFEGYECTMKRNGVGFEDEITCSFTLTDARIRGLDKKNPSYRTMPKIMCRKRASSQAGKELFSDVMQGVYTRLEVEEMQAANPEPEVITEGKEFEVIDSPELEVAIEEAEIVEDMSTIKKDISGKYKEIMKLFPDEWTIDYIMEHNRLFLGVQDAKKCDDLDKLKALLTDLESRIDKIEQEV